MFWTLVFAADMVAGEGPAKEPKRRVKMDVMVGEWVYISREGREGGRGESSRRGGEDEQCRR